ncbi:hypothetical protein LY78DRAFT_223023 [Colletotrichum sublineola]|nr:hypothetical protein LY78DRAFT_223023 [Colletotrichum sublineola]
MHCIAEGAIAYLIPVGCGVVWSHLIKNIDSLTAGYFSPSTSHTSTNKSVAQERKKKRNPPPPLQ